METSLPKSTLPIQRLVKFSCEICLEKKPYNNCFSINGCNHSYCSDCVAKYIESKLEDNVIRIQCPSYECISQLHPETCRSIIAHQVFDKWITALSESSLPQTCKLYCPYKDCAAALLLINDDVEVTRSECPYCRRFLCVQCKVGWHMGIDCKEFQRLKKDEEKNEDMLLHQLAEENCWIQCPQCNFYIELWGGCYIMHCRYCGCGFCYGCGVAYGDPSGHVPNTMCTRGFMKRAKQHKLKAIKPFLLQD